MAFVVDLVSPEKLLYSGEADMVVARSVDGEIAFCPGHIPFVGILRPEQVKVCFSDGTAVRAAVHSGFVEVGKDRVTILTDMAELAEEIDLERAQASQAEHTQTLASSEEDSEAEAGLRRANLRITVKETQDG